MKPVQIGPGIRRAIEYLTTLVQKPIDPAAGKLPSLKRLAEKAGVSRSSMWKAAGILRQQEVISFVHGGSIRIAGATETRREEGKGIWPYWEKKRNALAADILDNRFANLESLPTMSELQSMYGVSFATIKKILASLESSGILVSSKRTYRVASAHHRRFQSTIVVISVSADAPEFDVIHERMQVLIASLERQCTHTGHMVRMTPINAGDRDPMIRAIRSFHGDDSIAGYVLNVWWMGRQQWQAQYEEAIRLLAVHQKPFAMLDHVGNFPTACMPPNADARFFRPASRHGGECAARLLLMKGHRHIAYLSMWHHLSWSIDRLSGVERLIRMTGDSAELHIVAEHAPFWDDAAILQAASLTPVEFEELFLPGLSPAGVSAMRRLFDRAQTAPGFPPDRKPEIEHACADLKALAKLFHGKMSDAAFAVMRADLFRRIYYAISDSYARTLFEKALLLNGVTAWICSSDDTAIRAQSFLKKKGVRVPQDISIIGFDNKLRSIEEQVTSYDFNIESVALHMMRYLFAQEKTLTGGQGKIFEIEGFLVERASTGPARSVS